MIRRTKIFAAVLALAFAQSVTACTPDPARTERWTTTENTTVALDWDKVNEAYQKAEGPADLEKRINEIYEGPELISIAVSDADASTQVVTGFFDKNSDGKVDDPEKIFTMQRKITGEGQAQLQTQGYGPYAGYASPVMGIVSGMLLGSMMSSMFMPSYMPMYQRPYITSGSRRAELAQARSSYRSANPERYSKPSRTGRSYGGGATTRSGAPSGSRGGSRFGRRVSRAVVLLTA
jgi:hypothetical protein